YIAKTWEWIKQITDVDVKPENTLENWVIYREKSCKNSEVQRFENVNEFGKLTGEYGLVACMNQFSKECKEMEESIISTDNATEQRAGCVKKMVTTSSPSRNT
ncbi:hypothetical protein AVEN_257991-1, partial [Araneus ventricosus]